ncbi:TPA: hypothetical protein ACJINV_003384 [Escherichia coli]|uniref:hypothetical protein n=1 Tax=Escherichia coli TaxID=562 RepID=UPI0019872D81|nr:hypothetical protein [Escherichia coli]EIQ0325353.1 hypothetical protein [Escherichia coli]EJA0971093.1 hypothetical protein [Escherichia coli]CAD6080993.1 Uncharacterised protein [Escherichia coli]CAD6545006.1 Uncharacterised protein [Escherichia coli]
MDIRQKASIPDLDNPLFITYSQLLLKEFDQRYDGNDNLAFFGIGMVGARVEAVTGNIQRSSTRAIHQHAF